MGRCFLPSSRLCDGDGALTFRVFQLSDVHNDFATEWKQPFLRGKDLWPRPNVDAVVLCGDDGNSEYAAEWGFAAFDDFKGEKFAVPGNHDTWYGEWDAKWKKWEPAEWRRVAKKHGFTVPGPGESLRSHRRSPPVQYVLPRRDECGGFAGHRGQ